MCREEFDMINQTREVPTVSDAAQGLFAYVS